MLPSGRRGGAGGGVALYLTRTRTAISADLGAERLISAEKGIQKIVVEVTSIYTLRQFTSIESAIKSPIQYDDTEEGIATDLLEAGVPKADIVLGFRHPKIREYTGFAVA